GSHGVLIAEGVRLTVGPDGFTCRRIHGHYVTTGTGNGVQHAIDVARRGAAARRTETGAIPDPGFLQVTEVPGIDLVGWRIASVVSIAAKAGPFDGVLSINCSSRGQRQTKWKRPQQRAFDRTPAVARWLTGQPRLSTRFCHYVFLVCEYWLACSSLNDSGSMNLSWKQRPLPSPLPPLSTAHPGAGRSKKTRRITQLPDQVHAIAVTNRLAPPHLLTQVCRSKSLIQQTAPHLTPVRPSQIFAS